MDLVEREIRKLALENGDVPFDIWFNDLRDIKLQAAVDARLARVRAGNLGDLKVSARAYPNSESIKVPGCEFMLDSSDRE